MLTLQRTKLLLAIVMLLSMVVALAVTSQPTTISVFAKSQEERKLENLMPKHVPLRIRIKKEKEKKFKDLGNENWARDFEVEVTNTGDKPIYQFYLRLVLDVKDTSGQNVLSQVYYGRNELGDHRVPATPEDVPLKPGESSFHKIHPGQLEAWDIIWRQEGLPQPTNIQVIFQMLSFGDRTGLVGPDAQAVPRKIGKQPLIKRAPTKPPGGLSINELAFS